MSNLPALLRNTAVLGAGTAVSKALVLISTLVLARLLGPEDFGRYTLVFAYLAFFELVADAGLDTLVVREAARGEAAVARRLGDSLVLRAVLIAAALPIALVLVPLVTDDPGDLALVALGGAALLASPRRTSLARLLEVPFRVRLEMGVPTLLAVGTEALHLALLPLAIRAAGTEGAVAVQALAPLPFAIVLAVLSARRLRPVLAPTLASLGRLLRAAAPLLGIVLLNVVLVRVDVVMLRMLRGPLDVGLYGAPVRLVETANLLPALVMTSVFPLMAAAGTAGRERVDRLFRGTLRTLLAVLGPVVALEILFAEPLLAGLFGPAYAAGSAALVPLALAELLIFVDVVVTFRLVATGHEARNLAFVGLAAVVNVLANLLLIPAHGIEGAALATLLAYGVRAAAALGPADTRGVGVATAGALAPVVAAGAVAFGLPALLPLPRPLAAAIGLVAYGPLLAAFGGAPTREEIVRLAGARRETPPAPSRPFRVLWISSPVSSAPGGGERFVERLLRGLPHVEHELLGTSDALHAVFRRLGLPAVRAFPGWEPVTPRGVLLWPLSRLLALRHVLRHLDRFRRADVVVSPTCFTEPLLVLPWILDGLGRTPIVFGQNARTPRPLRRGPLHRALRRVLARSLVVVPSKTQHRAWRALGLAPDGTEVIAPGVPVRPWSPQAPRAESARIGFLGRLHEEKGVDLLLEAARRLPPTGRRVDFVVAGDGPLAARVRAAAEAPLPGGGRLLVPGPVDDAAAYLATLDLLVVPSRRESFGIVVVEAWERGVPVLSADLPALRELREAGPARERDLLFAPGDADDLAMRLAAAIRRLPSLRTAEAGEARRDAVRARFDERLAVARFAALLERAAGRRISPVAGGGNGVHNGPSSGPERKDPA